MLTKTKMIVLFLLFQFVVCTANSQPPATAKYYYEIGDSLQTAGNPATAIYYFNLSLEANNEMNDLKMACLTYKAGCKYALGDFEGSINDCNYVLNLNQKNIIPYIFLPVYMEPALNQLRGLCYMSRGMSKVQLNLPNACEDLQAAKKLGINVDGMINDYCR
jgi:tetratricopeptide (TPR) repeat protein